jgi:hypothetical protein
MRAGIYSGSTPNALVVKSGSEACSAAAWHTFTIPETFLAAGTTYWIAYATNTSNAALKDDPGGSVINTYARNFTYGDLPSTFSTLQYSATAVRSAYVLVSYDFASTTYLLPTPKP